MGAIHLLVLIAVIGFVGYLINRFIPMAPAVKTVIVWVTVGIILLIILEAFGILGMDVGIPKLR